MKDMKLYLEDMLDYLGRVQSFTVDGREAFMQDVKIQLAVIRVYEVIGEIAKRLPDSLRDAYPKIDWRKLIGFRDFLAHNYEEIILEFVWAAVEDLPNLKPAIESILSDLSTNESLE